jgi:hypothetical protein
MQNHIMKKTIFFAIATLAGSVAFTQNKQTKPPPPPPTVNLEKVAPPLPPPVLKQPSKTEHFASPNNADYKEFLKRNPTVKRIGWADNNAVHIYLKSGKEEKYNLKKETDMRTLENKYGELPAAPPPPPKVTPKKFPPPVIKGS